jgi:hypothetical protein
MGETGSALGVDIDGDNKVDLVSSNRNNTNFSIRQNTMTPPPVITVTGTLIAFNQCVGTPSASQTITVGGENLTTNISIGALTNFQYSLNDTTYASTLTLTPVSGSVAPRTIFIRYNNTIAGSNSGNISLTSTGATTVNVAASGTCFARPTIASTTPASRFCTGTVTLAATASAGTINWYAAQTGGSSLFTGNSFTTPSISTTTTYFVDATNNGCTTATRTGVTATINSAAITVQPVPQTICGPTSPLSLSVNATGGGTLTYQWRKGLSNIPGANASTFTIPSATAADTGSYSVVVTDSCANTATSNAASVTFNSIPAPVVANASLCAASGNVTLTNTGTVPANYGIRWYDNAALTVLLSTSNPSYTRFLSSSDTMFVRYEPLATMFSGVNTIDHNSLTGDDRGNIVVTQNYVYFFGDANIARYNASNLTGGTVLPLRDGLFATYGGTGTLYAFGNSSAPFGNGVGTATHVWRVDSALNTIAGSAVALSASVTLTGTLASGPDFVLVGASTIVKVNPVTGAVTTLTTTGTALAPNSAEIGPATGYATLENGNHYITYRASSLYNSGIARFHVEGNTNTVVFNPGVNSGSTVYSDLAAIAYSPWNNRVYFHHEGGRAATASTPFAEVGGYMDFPIRWANSCNSAVDTVVVTVGAPPTITGTTAASRCSTGTVTLSATASAGVVNWYTTSTGGTSIFTGTNFTAPSISSTTTYFVDATNNGCTSTSRTSVVATVNALPTATATAATATTFCQGGSVVINANTGAGLTYQWRNASGNISGATNASLTANAAGAYKVVVTNTNGCIDSSAAVNVTVNALPTATATAATATTFCQGGSVVINANTGAGLTYQWRNAGVNVPLATNASLTATTSGSYRVVVTNSNGCIDSSAAVSVTVVPSIAGNTIASNQSILINTTPAQLTGTLPTGGTGSYTYSWLVSTTGATSGFSAIASTNTQNYSPGVLSQNTWYRRLVTSGSCSDTTAALSITVNANIANNTISAAQTICSGTTPAGLTGLTPSGGTGSFTYTWLVSTTSASTGFSAAPGTNNAQNYTPGALTQTSWYRRYVVSGAASDTSAAIQITVSPVIAANTATGTQSICTGQTPTAIAGSTPTGGSGTYTYSWLSSTTSATAGYTSATGTNNVQNYAPAALTASTWYRRLVTSGGCSDTSAAAAITVNPAITTNTLTGGSTICNGNTTTINGTAPAGGSGSYTYSWLSSSTGATSGFSIASGTNNTQNYTTAPITANTWLRRLVSSGGCTDTSLAAAVTVTNTNTWSGTTGTAWGTTTNWGCGRIPVITDNVVIVPAANQPVITDGGRVANDLTINTGATLTINNAASVLAIGGAYTNNGTLTHTAGELVFAGAALQNIPAGTYSKINVNNAVGVTLTGNVSMSDSLKLSNGNVTLGSNNLTLSGTASVVSNASASRYIRTNGTGALIIQNIGSTGRTGAVSFPVGNSSYNPLTLTNAGTSDNYTVRVLDNVTNTPPTGLSLTNNVVGRTWVANEAVAGGSNATVTVQWSAVDELTGFTRAASYVALHNGTTWMATAATSAAGSNPYTQTRTGITSFSYFGVGSTGTLPVELLTFTAERKGREVSLDWATASEHNNDYFIIERSTDNINYTVVGKVQGQGTTAKTTAYQLMDDVSTLISNKIKVAYYRLKQVDLDGSINEAKTVNVDISEDLSGMTVTANPNPFQHSLAININIAKQEKVTLQVTDMTGKLITEQVVEAASGSNQIMLQGLENLKAGMYFVNVMGATEISTIKVVKQQ